MIEVGESNSFAEIRPRAAGLTQAGFGETDVDRVCFSPGSVGRGTTEGMSANLALGVIAVLLVRVGFALYAVGLGRSKHATASAVRALVELCFAVVAYWAVGAALVQPTMKVLGVTAKAFVGLSPMTDAQFVGMVIAVLATSLVGAVIAERATFWVSVIAAATVGGIVAPVACSWAVPTNGWLVGHGSAFAFPSVAVAGFGAVALGFVGARVGKYRRDGSTALIPGHALPLAVVGAMLAVAGLMALAARVELSFVAVAVGGVVSTLVTQLKFGKPDVGLILVGVLGAAVTAVAVEFSTTAPPFAGAVAGALAGAIVPHFAYVFDLKFKRDDPAGGLAIFGVGGALGVLLGVPWGGGAGVSMTKFVLALAGLAAAVAFGATIGFVTFTILKRVTKLRGSDADESDGLDLVEHDVSAYPDFQQNTIRSFHMREA